jgi:predicted phosphoribosyltransferase
MLLFRPIIVPDQKTCAVGAARQCCIVKGYRSSALYFFSNDCQTFILVLAGMATGTKAARRIPEVGMLLIS